MDNAGETCVSNVSWENFSCRNIDNLVEMNERMNVDLQRRNSSIVSMSQLPWEDLQESETVQMRHMTSAPSLRFMMDCTDADYELDDPEIVMIGRREEGWISSLEESSGGGD
jgi:hypothetical protein